MKSGRPTGGRGTRRPGQKNEGLAPEPTILRTRERGERRKKAYDRAAAGRKAGEKKAYDKAYYKVYRARTTHKEEQRARDIRYKYNMTLTEYSLLASQAAGHCALCGQRIRFVH